MPIETQVFSFLWPYIRVKITFIKIYIHVLEITENIYLKKEIIMLNYNGELN